MSIFRHASGVIADQTWVHLINIRRTQQPITYKSKYNCNFTCFLNLLHFASSFSFAVLLYEYLNILNRFIHEN